jgi:hypothetical protein
MAIAFSSSLMVYAELKTSLIIFDSPLVVLESNGCNLA